MTREIAPHVGSVVLFQPAPTDGMLRLEARQLHAAVVVFAHTPHRVNLVVYDHYGVAHSRTGVQFVVGAETREPAYALWPKMALDIRP